MNYIPTGFPLVVSLIILLPTLILLLSSILIVNQRSRLIIQRFGKFNRVVHPGLSFRIPIVEQIATELEMRILELIVQVETKTKDNVFVEMSVAVQYQIQDPEKAFYELVNPTAQIESYVFDVIRAKVPLLTLDKVYETKDEVADAVKSELTTVMSEFGYDIIKALVTDIRPDAKVKESMNEINATERLKKAAENEAEAAKIRVVKEAEAQSESKKLQGEGIANQRIAIANGIKESTRTIKEGLGEAKEGEVMKILLLTQHYDTMESMAKTSGTKVMFVDQSPSALNNVSQQITKGTILGSESSE